MKLRVAIYSLLFVSPFLLAAQSLDRHAAVPLNNWPAERQVMRSGLQTARTTPAPQLQLPGGTATDTLIFVPIAPCRLADTRPGQGFPALGASPLSSLSPRNLLIAGLCGVPTGLAEAYSLNVTVVPANGTLGGYLVVYPNPGTPVPLTASITWNPGAVYQTTAVIVPASHDGSVNVAANFVTDVVIDINGYYAPPTDAADNTGLGTFALGSGTGAGNDNTAVGYGALANNKSGQQNTAIGMQVLAAAASGFSNTGVGAFALSAATTGSFNIAIGTTAGDNLTTGSSNIMIGNQGTSGDSGIIRIGTNQTASYMAGIYNATVTNGAGVYVDSTGHLGTLTTALFGALLNPESVHDLGDASSGLMRLRPVAYGDARSGSGAGLPGARHVVYGLIAEEVAAALPDLVTRGPAGQIVGVREHDLPILLLNELQRQYRHAQEQDETIRLQRQQLAEQREQSRKLEARVAAVEAFLAAMTPAGATADTAANRAPAPAASGR